MNETQKTAVWPVVIVTAVVAVGVGFGSARFLKSDAPAPAAAQGTETKAEKPKEQALKIPDDYLKAADITIEPLRSGSVASEVLAPATVVAPPGSEAAIVARATGVITKVDKRLGDEVRAGEVLATIESMQAASMLADSQVAAARAEAARRAFERERSLSEQGVTPRQDMETAKAALDVANAELARASNVARAARVIGNGQSIAVVSPIAGRITAQRSVLGASVTTDTEIFRVANVKGVQVEASVTAVDSRRVSPGDQATIVSRSGEPIEALVRSVTPTVAGNARTATVLLVPEQNTGELVVGEGVQVRLHTRGQGTNGFTVAEDAVQRIDGRDTVFVKTQEGFMVTPVLVGTRSNGVAQIVSGVKGDERVASRNAFLLKAEMSKSSGDAE